MRLKQRLAVKKTAFYTQTACLEFSLIVIMWISLVELGNTRLYTRADVNFNSDSFKFQFILMKTPSHA